LQIRKNITVNTKELKMKGIPFAFIFTGIISVLIGMLWGIEMAATQDHSLFPAHAHLNLLGWVTMSIFGFYYHLVPAAAASKLAKVHYGLALIGLVVIVPGIVLAEKEITEGPAVIGSFLTLASMLVFAYTVWARRT
jgi:hypothetical protein